MFEYVYIVQVQYVYKITLSRELSFIEHFVYIM